MTTKERYGREDGLLDEIRRIGESVRDITPARGHLSMTWFPDGHMDVYVFTGERVKDKDGNERAEMVLNAWAEIQDGKMKVSRA